MKIKLLAGCALACAALSLGGCGAMQGLTAFNSALVPQLKPVDARIHTDLTCGDLAGKVMGLTAGQNALTASQVLAIVQFCEQRDATTTLTLDPQGARRVIEGIVNKPPVPGAGAVAAAVAP